MYVADDFETAMCWH